MNRIAPVFGAAALIIATASAQQPAAPAATPQQPNEISTTISSDQAGTPPRFAVPDFLALSRDAETIDAAQTIGRVLWDDLNFEREFALIPRDVYATIPPATSLNDVPFDRWRELNADGVVIGTVQKTDLGVRVEVRLYNVRSRQAVFSREYSGSVANKRLYAHTISDEIHQQQRALRRNNPGRFNNPSRRPGVSRPGPQRRQGFENRPRAPGVQRPGFQNRPLAPRRGPPPRRQRRDAR